MLFACLRQHLFTGTFSHLTVKVRNHFILMCIVNGIVALVFRLISIALTSASFIITEPTLGELQEELYVGMCVKVYLLM